jgi:transposase-like protein
MGLLSALQDVFGPDRDEEIRYRCQYCNRQFVYRADLVEPTCPYCGAATLEELGDTAT